MLPMCTYARVDAMLRSDNNKPPLRLVRIDLLAGLPIAQNVQFLLCVMKHKGHRLLGGPSLRYCDWDTKGSQ